MRGDVGKKFTEPIQASHKWNEYCDKPYSEKQEMCKLTFNTENLQQYNDKVKRAMLKAAEKSTSSFKQIWRRGDIEQTRPT